MASRHYLLEHDCGGVPTLFPANEAGLRDAVRTAESHVGVELYLSLSGQPMEKALCRRADVWLLDGKGHKLELVAARSDNVLQGGTAPVRGRASGLAERVRYAT